MNDRWTRIGRSRVSAALEGTVLVNEFGARAERAGWLTLGRELCERHGDGERFADAIDQARLPTNMPNGPDESVLAAGRHERGWR